MPKQRIIILISGIILASMAVFMVKVYLDKQRQIIEEQAKRKLTQTQANQSAVLAAKVDIPRGAVIEAEMLETAIVPNEYLQPRAVSSLDRIAGMVTIAPISKGEQISLTKLSYPQEAGRGGGLAEATPVGKRAITISVDNISALGGMIKPGDYVDVISMVPVPVQTPEGKQESQVAVIPLFQNVLVLAVGQDTGGAVRQESRYGRSEQRETPASPLLTLALTPQEASLIAFVQEQGKIRLSLRSPADSKIEPIKPASWETLFQYVMPQLSQTPEEDASRAQPKPTPYVEIYRGLSREKLPLSEN